MDDLGAPGGASSGEFQSRISRGGRNVIRVIEEGPSRLAGGGLKELGLGRTSRPAVLLWRKHIWGSRAEVGLVGIAFPNSVLAVVAPVCVHIRALRRSWRKSGHSGLFLVMRSFV